MVDQAAVDALYPDGLIDRVQRGQCRRAAELHGAARSATIGWSTDWQNVAYRAGRLGDGAGHADQLYGTAAPATSWCMQDRQDTERGGYGRAACGRPERARTEQRRTQAAAEDVCSISTLGNLDNAMDSILTVRAEVGARMNTADSAASLHQDVAVVSKDLLSKLQDIDYTQAISQLDMQIVRAAGGAAELRADQRTVVVQLSLRRVVQERL